MSYRVIIAASLLLAACSNPVREVAIPKAVPIPGPARYVELPADATADCDDVCPDLKDGARGRDLLDAYRACRARSQCRDGQIESIRRLQAPSVEKPK